MKYLERRREDVEKEKKEKKKKPKRRGHGTDGLSLQAEQTVI